MSEKTKIWREVKGYEGLYLVSSEGDALSLANSGSGRNGSIDTKLKPYLGNTGYFRFTFCKNGREKKHQVHRLLAQTFIPNPTNLPLVRHLNDIKTDNRIENLAWGTKSDNKLDEKRNGKMILGEKHHWHGCVGQKNYKSRLILDTQTGIFYNSATEAAQYQNFSKSYLISQLNGRNQNKTSLIYC